MSTSSAKALVRRVLRDGKVRSALLTGLVVGVAALVAGPRYPWPFAVMGLVWLVATVARVRAAAVAPDVTPTAAGDPDEASGPLGEDVPGDVAQGSQEGAPTVVDEGEGERS